MRYAIQHTGRGRVLLAAGILVLASGGVARAQQGWSEPVTLCASGCASTGTTDVYNDAVAVDVAGNATAVWAAGAIQARRFDMASGTWLAPTTLSAAGARQPHVAVDANGVVTAVWAFSRVQAVRYSPAAGTWSAIVDISPEDGLGMVVYPRVVADLAGNVFAVWGRASITSNLHWVQAARYDATTGTWGGAVDLSPPFALAVATRTPPQVVVDAAGNATAVWTGSNGGADVIKAARYAAAGGTWSVATSVSPETESWASPQVAIDTVGDITAVWTAAAVPGRVQVARYAASSGTWSTATDLAPSGFVADVAAAGEGHAVAIWSEPETPSTTRVQASRYNASTGTWRIAELVSTPGVSAGSPIVVQDGVGDATALWTEWVGPAPQRLTSARYPVDGGAWLFAGQMGGLPLYAQSTTPTGLAVDAAGHLTATWHRSTGPSLTVETGRWRATSAVAITGVMPLTGAFSVGTWTYAWFTRFAVSNIEYSLDDGATWTTRSPASPESPLFISGLASGVSYTIRLRAINVAGTGPPSEAVIATPGPAPGAPRDLFVASVAGNLVTIRWTAPPNSTAPTGYVLEGGVRPGEVLASIPTGNSGPAYTFVAPSGAFYIRVHTLAGALRSAASNEVRLFVNAPATPSSPAHLLGTANGDALTLSWVNTFGGGAPGSLWLNVTGSITATLPIPFGETFTYARVPPGTYTLAVSASNGSGTSAPSNTVTLAFPGSCGSGFPVGTGGYPGVPTNLQAWHVGNTVFVTWDPPLAGGAVTSYIVSVEGAYQGFFEVPGRALSGVAAPGGYQLAVMARNSCGVGPRSGLQLVTVP